MDNRLPGKPPQQHFLSRPDVETAAIIETGIAILQQQGRSAAEAYLRERGIGIHTRLRVLSASGYRRTGRSDTA
ncbi:hypothetical protein [Janthinobacterium sp.]|uniref:hypothetical protein n=1 Tax=Janthinobacterium sp. TaxID=1871054 RepID=UPI00289AF316|nr:hypothetical protein [Janthinobacterium sp.]